MYALFFHYFWSVKLFMSTYEPMWWNGGRSPSILNLVTMKEVSGQLTVHRGFTTEEKVKVKAVCGSYSTAALRHIVLLPK